MSDARTCARKVQGATVTVPSAATVTVPSQKVHRGEGEGLRRLLLPRQLLQPPPQALPRGAHGTKSRVSEGINEQGDAAC